MRLGTAVVALLAVALVPMRSSAAPGALDPSFGNSGVVETIVGSAGSGAAAVVVQSDGRIVAAGVATSGGQPVFAILRYETDGALDSTFATGGIALTPIGTSAGAHALVLQGDGKLVAAGTATVGGVGMFALARYDAGGALDPGFGTGGIVTTPIAAASAVYSLALQSDGSIVAAGDCSDPGFKVALARYDSHGVLDSSFGTSGIVKTLVGSYSRATAMRRTAGDALVVVGVAESQFLLLRYDSDGNLDPSFGSGGVVNTPAAQYASVLYAIDVQSDSRLVVAGHVDDVLAVARYKANGTLDTSFGTNGIVTNVLDSQESYATSVLVQPNGYILASGVAIYGGIHGTFGGTGLRVARFNASGAIDTSFGSGGYAGSFISGDFGGTPAAMAFDPTGLIVAGSGSSSSVPDVLLVRFEVNVCGDAVREPPEECDDGNRTDGDGCDTNCTLTACGNGIVTSGEDCDGGECCRPDCTFAGGETACADDFRVCTDDQCDGAGHCAHVPNTAPCDDGNVCTGSDTCSGGICAGVSVVFCPACQYCVPSDGSCQDGPRSDCLTTLSDHSSKLLLAYDSADASKTLIKWSWSNGTQTLLSDLGDPTASDSYDVCFFNTGWKSHIPAGGLCGDKNCWSSASGTGFRFHDPSQSNHGVDRLQVRSGPDGRSQILMQAKGENIEYGTLFSELFLPVRFQLQRGQMCWDSTFSRTGNGSTTGTRQRVALVGH